MTADLDRLRAQIDDLTAEVNPAMRAARGIGPDVASILLIAAGDNPERLHSEAAFAALCGASPVEASTGKTIRARREYQAPSAEDMAAMLFDLLGATAPRTEGSAKGSK